MLFSSAFSLSFPAPYLCPSNSSTSLPGWKVTQLGSLVSVQVEWTDNNIRGLVVVRNMRNVVAERPGKPGSYWCLWAGASGQCWCCKGVMPEAGLVRCLACVNRLLKWCRRQKTQSTFFSVFSSCLGLGPADGICCRSQKLLAGTMNSGVRLLIQWWDLQK